MRSADSKRVSRHAPIHLFALLALLVPGCEAANEAPQRSVPPTIAAVSKEDRTCCSAGESSDGQSAPGEGQSGNSLVCGPWIPPSERQSIPRDQPLTTHDGKLIKFGSLVGRPVAISFAYTRCVNPNKCPAVTAAMGRLGRNLAQKGMLDDVRLAMLTYDPVWDTPERLVEFSKSHRLDLGDSVLFLRPDPEQARALFSQLGIRVSFNPGGVSLHGIQMILVDRVGRIARHYDLVIWDDSDVIRDLRRLIDEPAFDTVATREDG